MYLALVAELWVYGVMKVLSWPLRIAFMSANLLFAVGLYLMGKKLDHIVWGECLVLAISADRDLVSKVLNWTMESTAVVPPRYLMDPGSMLTFFWNEPPEAT